jgi:hypothetical protein
MRGGSSWDTVVSSCSANCTPCPTGTQHLIVPVVLTDGMAAAIRETHLKRNRFQRVSTAPRDERSTLQVQVRPQQHHELQGGIRHMFFHAMLWMRRRRCVPLECMYRRGLPQRTTGTTYTLQFAEQSLSWRSSPPHPCKSCKSLRTRPSLKKKRTPLERRPHNRPRRHFLVL